MRLLAIAVLALAACAGEVTGAAASSTWTNRGFRQECISTSRVTEAVASRTVTTTWTATAWPVSAKLNSTTKYSNSTSVKNGTTVVSRLPTLWPSNSTSTSAPSILCFADSTPSSKCSCISISRVTVTSTVKSSTTTLTLTSVLPRLPPSSKSTHKSNSSSRIASSSRSSSSSSSTSSPSSSTKPVVYVLNATTLITVTAPTTGKPSAAMSLAANITTGRYLNLTTSASTSSQRLFTAPFINTTSVKPFFANTTSLSNPSFLNTTYRLPHNISLVTGTGSSHFNHSISTLRPPLWLNTTRSFLLPNRTIALVSPSGSSGYLLTTVPPRATGTGSPFSNSTTVRWSNTTSSATSSSTLSSYPTSCGRDSSSPPFQVQISHPSSLIDGFFGLLSGKGILFTSQQSRASRFSVESTGHLCVVGLVDGEGMPYVAAVGAKETDRSAVWMVSRDILEVWSEDYVALGCENSGAGIECQGRGNGTTALEGWVGCGVQLWMGEEGEEKENGAGCVRVGLGVVDLEAGDDQGNNVLNARRVDPMGFGVMHGSRHM
ncbi:hypothetical protein QBC44DRAFT_335462 [Cladorrhinum sp. PSN332]|nr:hypothetical protein QBC44DRAFT_335462 [Cladorrhinum sp. PSN332]